MCPHTAKTHLYANEDILHPMSPLKLKYYNLNSSDEGFQLYNSFTAIHVRIKEQ